MKVLKCAQASSKGFNGLDLSSSYTAILPDGTNVGKVKALYTTIDGYVPDLVALGIESGDADKTDENVANQSSNVKDINCNSFDSKDNVNIGVYSVQQQQGVPPAPSAPVHNMNGYIGYPLNMQHHVNGNQAMSALPVQYQNIPPQMAPQYSNFPQMHQGISQMYPPQYYPNGPHQHQVTLPKQ